MRSGSPARSCEMSKPASVGTSFSSARYGQSLSSFLELVKRVGRPFLLPASVTSHMGYQGGSKIMSIPQSLQGRLSLPVIGAPLFIISNPDLVIAQCKAGVIGSFPTLNARPAGVLDEWLARITEELGKAARSNPGLRIAPLAVNQIVHRTNARLEQDLDLCVKYRVPVVITSLGAREEVNRAVHAYGGIVLHDVINA